MAKDFINPTYTNVYGPCTSSKEPTAHYGGTKYGGNTANVKATYIPLLDKVIPSQRAITPEDKKTA